MTDLVQPRDAEIHVGKGISCFFDDKTVVHVGNRKLMEKKCSLSSTVLNMEPSVLLSEGKTVIHVAVGNQFLGTIAVSDVVKPNAASLVSSLQREGIEVWMLTGDHATTAKIIASKIGISHIEAGVSPTEKAKKIEELQSEGKKVIMVGDGINDAIALAQADVSGT